MGTDRGTTWQQNNFWKKYDTSTTNISIKLLLYIYTHTHIYIYIYLLLSIYFSYNVKYISN